MDDYDCGLINDWGGGNVDWWQDYIRAEIGRANDHWRAQVAALTPSPSAHVAGLNRAASDVLAERRRQVEVEGWTPEHDDLHTRDELSAAAASYAHFGWVRSVPGNAPTIWPWDASWWKPTNRRRDLVKAGALILAEIERLDRAAQKENTDGQA